MFNKIKSFIHEAVEALAPDVPLQETFVFHWKAITNYFIEATGEYIQAPLLRWMFTLLLTCFCLVYTQWFADEKVPVQSTNIPYHLEQMRNILRHEDDQMGGTAGPCLEYLLQYKILDTLHTLGRADCPPGMKQQVLLFFANILSKMKQPLLPHVNVYRPVHRLIRLSGEVKAAPSENEEIQFLCVVCAKLRQDPYLVNFFLESLGNSPTGLHPAEDFHPPPIKSEGRDKPDYTLDSRIAVKACEGLMLCASLPEDHAATVIILYTPFCEVMADRLKVLFEHLPKNMEPLDISAVAAKWGLDHQSDDEDVLSFPGKRRLISFLSWLDYVDQLSKEAHKLVGKALAVGVRERFLQPVMEPALIQQSELGIITATAILRRCVKAVTSPHLLQEICIFLLGEETSPEVPSNTGDHKLRQTLIQRCDHLSDEVSIETLKLFEALLDKPCEIIFNNLVLRNLRSRKYFCAPALTNGGAASNGPVTENLLMPPSPSTPPLTPDGLESPQIIDDVDREEVEQVVNSFISLVPDEIKTSALTGDTGYDTYLRDAHKQPYDVNLQVTSVIALLSQFNHPQLQEYLLNATLPLAQDCRTLHSTLQNVVQDLRGRIQRLPNFQRHVIAVRRQLMGVATTPEHKRNWLLLHL
ncbi:FHF complex subunit HOOK interacting protein 2A [Acropora cervicornis]|uniref:FHF complex subunit HOOK interacting protein 2A n=1 Tax=Acropora cervicornis TaxID=6130 RepID=A0AAD9VGD6_ACRCE|nr:FHF complex subunit HOOK interacting protein 2A [Acropora cervicornis]